VDTQTDLVKLKREWCAGTRKEFAKLIKSTVLQTSRAVIISILVKLVRNISLDRVSHRHKADITGDRNLGSCKIAQFAHAPKSPAHLIKYLQDMRMQNEDCENALSVRTNESQWLFRKRGNS
jgi:hypothetical protein